MSLPFGGRSARSRNTSLQGARCSVVRAGSQSCRMLVTYLSMGARTDLEMAEQLGLSESRISARRGDLLLRHLVAYHDEVMGPHGALNCRWMLTEYGRETARDLTRATV